MTNASTEQDLDQAPSAATLAEAVLSGDRRSLARAITLIESTRADHRAQADQLLTTLMPHTGNAMRLGISGAPGVGKSTFIEALGSVITEGGKSLAVLAVDPSSRRSGGSILGDKTRMETLSRNQNAFIRPSPAGLTLGGVARRTREAGLICEAAGFDVILVETVGVGQSETTVAEMTDMFLLLLAPAGGDELQGIKRGVVELADLILVNKADGTLLEQAKRSAAEYKNALGLLRPKTESWHPEVHTCSALTQDGMRQVWDRIDAYKTALQASDEWGTRRHAQAVDWLWSEISDTLLSTLRSDPKRAVEIAELEDAVRLGHEPPVAAAGRLVRNALKNRS